MFFIFPLFLFANSFAKDITFSKYDSSFNINRELKKELYYKGNIKNILALLNQKDPGFDFIYKVKSFIEQTTKEKEFTIDLLFFSDEYLYTQGVDIKNAITELQQKISEYHEMKGRVNVQKIEHYYVDRMNCKQTTSTCYNLKFSDYMINYDIPFRETYNFLKNNLDEYLADPDHFVVKAMKELNIKNAETNGIYQSIKNLVYQKRDNLVEFSDVKDALAKMLEELSEFFVDQRQYKTALEKRIQAIATTFNIKPNFLEAIDKFPENTISVAKGEIVLTNNIALYYADDLSVNKNIDILINYFNNLDLNNFLQDNQ